MSELVSVTAVDPNEQESISAYSQLLEALETEHALRTQPEQVATLVNQLTPEEITQLQWNAIPALASAKRMASFASGLSFKITASGEQAPPSDAIQDNLAWIEDFCRTLSVAKERLKKNMPSQDHPLLRGTDLAQVNAKLQEEATGLRRLVAYVLEMPMPKAIGYCGALELMERCTSREPTFHLNELALMLDVSLDEVQCWKNEAGLVVTDASPPYVTHARLMSFLQTDTGQAALMRALDQEESNEANP